ncbi:hypothetical protein ABEF95_004585 [Exophiala dermatitidis]
MTRTVSRDDLLRGSTPGRAHLRDNDFDADVKPTASEDGAFTLRAVLMGCLLGIFVCTTNMYFGLQTGYTNGMSSVSSLLGFVAFKGWERCTKRPVLVGETVLLQTVASATGCFPSTAGLLGAIPALEFLTPPALQGPLELSWVQLLLWSLGLSLFGLIWAMMLRGHYVDSDRLPWPGANATAILIRVLHGQGQQPTPPTQTTYRCSLCALPTAPANVQVSEDMVGTCTHTPTRPAEPDLLVPSSSCKSRRERYREGYDWWSQARLLVYTGLCAAVYGQIMYLFPILHDLPVFGQTAATEGLWTMSTSPGYFGTGVVTGPETTMHMLLGTIVGWGVLAPLSKRFGWAPGDVGDWEKGARGWIIWISLSALLTDCVVKMLWTVVAEPLFSLPWRWHWLTTPAISICASRRDHDSSDGSAGIVTDDNDIEDTRPLLADLEQSQFGPVQAPRSTSSTSSSAPTSTCTTLSRAENQATPRGQRISITYQDEEETTNTKTDIATTAPRSTNSNPLLLPILSSWTPSRPATIVALVFAICLCLICTRLALGSTILSAPLVLLAVMVSLPLSVLGIRSLAETDYNPMSGIGKISQILFAFFIPHSNPYRFIINIIVGAIAEAGASQAGDISYDLKVGQLVVANSGGGGDGDDTSYDYYSQSPQTHPHPYSQSLLRILLQEAQLYGQIVGSIFGAFVSVGLYKLYTHDKAKIPSRRFPIPVAHVWILAAKLATGMGNDNDNDNGAGAGSAGFPEKSIQFSIATAAVFVLMTVLRITSDTKKTRWRRWIPGGVAFAIGIYNTPAFTTTRALGGLFNWYWLDICGKDHDTLMIWASGLLFGESVAGIFTLLVTTSA